MIAQLQLHVKPNTDSIEMEIPRYSLTLPRLFPDKRLGKTIVPTLGDKQIFVATVVQKRDYNTARYANIKFVVELGGCTFDLVRSYGTLCNCIEDLEEEYLTSDHKVWTFNCVIGHQGSNYNVT
jgi:hypothetical protein